MRVLHVLCDRSTGGAETQVLALCRHSGGEVAFVQRGGSLLFTGIETHDADRIPGRPGGRALARLTRLASHFDVVHTPLWAGHTWGGTASWLARCPARIVTVHNVDREPIYKRLMRKTHARLAHRVVAVSTAVARWSGADTVIPNGIDLAPYHRPWIGGDGLLAAGRLVPQKGFDVLVRAKRDLPLTIVGSGPEHDALQRADPDVSLPGHVGDLPERLARADVVVIPSRWEGFGLVAVEAMAAGAPIIASRVDGLAEVLGDAAILVEPNDAAALAQAIRSLIENPSRQQALSQAGQARAQQFTLERTAAAYRALYDTVLSRG